MPLVKSFITALITPFVLPAPTATSSKPKPQPGYQTVYNTCNSPANLYCCNGTGVGGGADEPTDTQTGCTHAAVGNPPSVDFRSGYCPATGGYIPLCCDVFVSGAIALYGHLRTVVDFYAMQVDGIVAGCDIPNQSP